MADVLQTILDTALDAAPWLLFGLMIAGFVQALVPQSMLRRWIGGRGVSGITRAAVIGAPLPLCSCGAIPTALTLHRGGAGRGPTTAFLIGTPGIGVDSLAISYALLGPFMMVARAGMAVGTAIATGLLVAMTDRTDTATATAASAPSGPAPADHCDSCHDGCESHTDAAGGLRTRLAGGLRYAFTEVLDDISVWLVIGLIMAGLLMALVPATALAELSTHPAAKVLMAVIGIPLYICATAATPIAAGLLVAGATPGTVLVFLVAGPVTSLATLGMIGRSLGRRALTAYLAGIVIASVALGILVDAIVAGATIDVVAQSAAAGDWLPLWLKAASLLILAVLVIRPLRRLSGRALLPTGSSAHAADRGSPCAPTDAAGRK